MARKRPKREQWDNKRLMHRLAALENASVLLPAVHQQVPQIETKRIHGPIAFFALGFVCAVLFGLIAAAIVLIGSPETARASMWVPAGVATSENAAGVEQTATYRIAMAAAPGADRTIEGRQVWWKLPRTSGH